MLETLAAQARLLWGEADAERQRPALSQTAEEMAVVARTSCRLTWSQSFLPDISLFRKGDGSLA